MTEPRKIPPVPSDDSDQVVRDEALRHLRLSAHLPLRELSFDYQEGILTIEGQVPTYYLKQLAQTRLTKLPGVRKVHNLVEVVPTRSP